jgi:hypothetical protein
MFTFIVLLSSIKYWISVNKPEGRRLLGRPGHRLQDNIKMDIRWVMGWINLAWGGE